MGAPFEGAWVHPLFQGVSSQAIGSASALYRGSVRPASHPAARRPTRRIEYREQPPRRCSRTGNPSVATHEPSRFHASETIVASRAIACTLTPASDARRRESRSTTDCGGSVVMRHQRATNERGACDRFSGGATMRPPHAPRTIGLPAGRGITKDTAQAGPLPEHPPDSRSSLARGHPQASWGCFFAPAQKSLRLFLPVLYCTLYSSVGEIATIKPAGTLTPE
jgi:hypothetical protein